MIEMNLNAIEIPRLMLKCGEYSGKALCTSQVEYVYQFPVYFDLYSPNFNFKLRLKTEEKLYATVFLLLVLMLICSESCLSVCVKFNFLSLFVSCRSQLTSW